MKYDVIVSVPVEFEFVIEADDEAEARKEAVAIIDEHGIHSALDQADCVSTGAADVADSWPLRDGYEDPRNE